MQKQISTKIKILTTLCLVMPAYLPSSLQAAPYTPPLEIGMKYEEVLTAWGGPMYKEEQETKRRDIWFYKNSKAIFDSGRLKAWGDINESVYNEMLPAKNSAVLKPIPESLPPASKPSRRNRISSEVMDEIMAEIMRDPSSGNAADSKLSTAPRMPVPNVINPGAIE